MAKVQLDLLTFDFVLTIRGIFVFLRDILFLLVCLTWYKENITIWIVLSWVKYSAKKKTCIRFTYSLSLFVLLWEWNAQRNSTQILIWLLPGAINDSCYCETKTNIFIRPMRSAINVTKKWRELETKYASDSYIHWGNYIKSNNRFSYVMNTQAWFSPHAFRDPFQSRTLLVQVMRYDFFTVSFFN